MTTLSFTVSPETVGKLLRVRRLRGLSLRTLSGEVRGTGGTTPVQPINRSVRSQDAELILTVRSRGGPRPVTEARLRLVSGATASLFDAALILAAAYDFQLVGREQPEPGAVAKPVKRRGQATIAEQPVLDPGAPVGTAFLDIMHACLRHLFANRGPVLRGRPEAIHQTRVALRRLRAGLDAFRDILPAEPRVQFSEEFRWLQRRLSASRDWHVFLVATLPAMAEDGVLGRRELGQVRRVAREARAGATARSVERLQGHRVTRMLLAFDRWLATLEEEIPADLFQRPLLPFAVSVCAETRQALLAEQRPLSRLPNRDLHALRKRGKHARYAIEFFGSLWGVTRVAPSLRLMEALQDSLGATHDMVMARHLLWLVTPDRLDPALALRLADWSEARVRTLATAANPGWRRLGRQRPFWSPHRVV